MRRYRPFVRPARFGPPQVARSVVPRPRLMPVLAARFEYRLTVVDGAGGFGKTTVLAQAVEVNNGAPRGIDVWLTCEAADASSEHLLTAIARSLGAEGVDIADVSTIADLVWRRAPTPVAIILDDVHVISTGSPGANAIRGVVEELPANGHVVIAGRAPLPLPYARLVAQERALVIGEDELRLTADELIAVAERHGLAPDALDASGGWPALAALGAAAGPHAARRFVLEEVYLALSEQTRAALDALCVLEGGDAALVSAVLDRAVDLDGALTGVPLVARHDAGWYRPHALWRPIVEQESDAQGESTIRRRGALALHERGDFATAANLILRGPLDDEDWEVFRAFAAEGCQIGTWAARGELVASWHARLPPSRQQTPEGQLLDAAAVRLREGDSDDAADRFETALAAAADAGNVAVELAALSQLGHLAWWRDDLTRGFALSQRAAELAAVGWRAAEPIAAFADAMVAELSGDSVAMLRLASAIDRSSLSPLLAGAADWLEARALLQLGRAEEAIPLAERACSAAGFGAAETSRAIAYFQAGHLDEAVRLAAALDPRALASARDRVLFGVTLAAGWARLGRTDRARQAEAIAAADASAVTGARAATFLELARVLIRVADGEEDAAAHAVADAIGPVDDEHALRPLLAFLPAVYILAPDLRPRCDAMELGPDHADARAVARALVDVRSSGSTNATTVPPDRVIAALGVHWAAELAAATDDDRLAERSMRIAPEATSATLRRIAAGDGTTRAQAVGLLRRVAIPPDRPVVVRMLGPATIERDGVPFDHPDWRRERVRSLLAYLLFTRRATRGGVAATLWPDLDPDAALGNLRVTLRYLQRVLQPERDAGAAPWFIRSHGDVVTLTTDFLVVDVWELERHLDAATEADAAGRIGHALDELELALSEWRGEFFPDGFDDWATVERDRIRARVIAAAIRAGELLLGQGANDRALELATRAITAEPWSEPAYRLAISAHLARGDRASARRALHSCHAMLDELGVGSEPATRMLERRLDPMTDPIDTR